MNTVAITGRLTADPQLTKLARTEVCDLRVAENGSGPNPLFVDVAVFGPSARTCAEHLKKGRLVAVDGRLRLREWEAKDGTRRSCHSIVANRVDFLGLKPEGSGDENSDGQVNNDPATPPLIGLAQLVRKGSEPVSAEF